MEGYRMHTINKQSFNTIQHPAQQMLPPTQQQFTKHAIDLKKDSEKLQNDQERLSSLHSKLHKEAEKIRNWKNEKEIELKQKDRSLSDALQTIESLRKSIYELQVQNESYSTKLHQTELEKEETEQNIKTVREMANMLRDQMINLESRIVKGEQDKENINQTNQNLLEENQVLLLKFQDLDISNSAMVEKYSKQFHDIEIQYSEKVMDLESNIHHLENQVVSLIELKANQEKIAKDYGTKLKANEELIGNLNNQLNNTINKLHQTEQMLNAHQKSLTETSTSFFEVSEKLNYCNEKLIEAENLCKFAQSERDAKDIHTKEIEEIYTKEISSLQGDIKDLTMTLNQTKVEIEKLNEQIIMKEDNIATLKEKLNMQTVTLNDTDEKLNKAVLFVNEMELFKKNNLQTIESYEDELFNLKEKLKESIDANITLNLKISELNESFVKLKLEKSEYQDQVQNLKTNFEVLIMHDKDRQRKIDEYEMQIESTKAHITSLDLNILHLKSKNNDLKNEFDKLNKEKGLLTTKVDELQCSIEEKVQNLSEQQQKSDMLLTEIFNLKKTNIEQETTLSKLKEKENENAQNMKSEIADHEKKSEDLGNKTKSLQSQINIKAKQLKSIEKECKSLKNQLKLKTEKIEKLEEQLKASTEQIASSSLKLSDCARKLDATEKELNLIVTRCDSDQREFCLTLEHYKIENDKIVESYDNDNSAMKLQIEELQKCLSDKNDNLRSQLKEAIQLSEYQKLTILQFEERVSEMSLHESRNQELEKLVKVLSHQVDSERSNCQQIQAEYEQKFKSQITRPHEFNKDYIPRIEEQLAESKQLHQISPAKSFSMNKPEDRLVPATPHIMVGSSGPVTPQSILRSSYSKRGKRVLFTGMDEKENYIPMDTNELNERPPKTPALNELYSGNKSALVKSNTRYSPKPDPYLVKQLLSEERAEGIKKECKKVKEYKSHVDNLIEAHLNVVNNPSNKTFHHNFKTSRSYTGNVNKSAFKKKNKKVTKIKNTSAEQNLSWFDSDSVFGFDG